MRLLTGSQISSILRNLSKQEAERLHDALASALASYTSQQTETHTSEGHTHQPLRTVIQTSQGHTSLFMPVSDESTTAIKVATVPKQGDIQGAVTLYTAVGELFGVLNAAEITAFRTALAIMTVLSKWASAISNDSKHSRGRSGHRVVVFGGGKQAEWHVRLIPLLITGVKSISIMSRSSARLERFVETVINPLRQVYPEIEFTGIHSGQDSYKTSMQASIREASIICCCTPSTEPLFTFEDVTSENNASKRFISLIGSYKPEMQEIDTETLRSASQIVVDSKEACLEEAGELIRAKTTKDDVVEAGELLYPGSQQSIHDQHGLVVFKCVGFALMDLTISLALLKLAEDKDEGMVIDGF